MSLFHSFRRARRILALLCLVVAPTAMAAGYSWHRDISATLFWAGEDATAENGFISNAPSAWDSDWASHYGGIDEPFTRDGFAPASFTPNENPFYFALPFGDFTENGRKRNLAAIVPWIDEMPADEEVSVLKNRWIEIRAGGRSVYAQWEDVGPFQENDFRYVFGHALPRNRVNRRAGLDMSPAVWDALGLNKEQGITKVDWRFVDATEVPPGPWKAVVTDSPTYWWEPGLKAFHGADVAGATTPGGRGGRIVEVVNLDADGPGSLRAALAQAGKRVILFRVGGVIDLRGGELLIDQPYVMVAAQSAPGDGIVVANGSLRIATHDVVLRGLRLRNLNPGVAALLRIDAPPRARNIVIDHCSLSNATGRALEIAANAARVGLSWNLIAERDAGLAGSEGVDARHNLFVSPALPDDPADNLFAGVSGLVGDHREDILSYAGALANGRDAIDSALVAAVLDGREASEAISTVDWSGYGQTVDDRPDSDDDGMPDAWERARGQDEQDPDDAWDDHDNDDYPNIEDYLDGLLARDRVGVSLGSPPAAVTLVAPLDHVAGDAATTTFVWRRVAGASAYRLWIRPVKANGRIDWRHVIHDAWHETSGVGCAGSGDDCRLSLTLPAAIRGFAWKVQARNGWGEGGWSRRVVLRRPGTPTGGGAGGKPGRAVPLSPLGDGHPLRATFRWQRGANAERYRLWVRPLNAHGGIAWREDISNRWYGAAQVGCAGGGESCSVVLRLPRAGGYAWRVLTRNRHGFGGWSPIQRFRAGD